MKPKGFFSIFDNLDPGDALGEVLFGLIMALTWTLAPRLVLREDGLVVRDLVVATIGCNLAWGIIDAVMFTLGTTFFRSRRLRLFRHVKTAKDEEAALAVLAKEFPIEEIPLSARPADAEALYRSLLALTTRAEPVTRSLTKGDLTAAAAIFLLVSSTALPAVVPFFLIDDADSALRASNLFLVLLLFVTGYKWADFSGGRPVFAGITMICLGLFLVAIAIALGG